MKNIRVVLEKKRNKERNMVKPNFNYYFRDKVFPMRFKDTVPLDEAEVSTGHLNQLVQKL